MNWTDEDERILQELQERKQAYENMVSDAVGLAVDHLIFSGLAKSAIHNALTRNATHFRKVLEPFGKESK